MTDRCLAPNSPGALAAARAYRDQECVLLCDGRPSYFCRHDPKRERRLFGGDIAGVYTFDGPIDWY